MSNIWEVKDGTAFDESRNVAGVFSGELKDYHPNHFTKIITRLTKRNSGGKIKECLEFEFPEGAPDGLKILFGKLIFKKRTSKRGREMFVAKPKKKDKAYILKDGHYYYLRRAELHYLGEYDFDNDHWNEFVDILFWEKKQQSDCSKNPVATESSFGRSSWPWRD